VSVIEIRDLRVTVIVGVLPPERVTPQPLSFDIDFVRDISDAVRTDDVQHTTNYAAVITRVCEVAAEGQFQLLETLAHRVGEMVLRENDAVTEVTVMVRKLEPPVSETVATVGVRVTLPRP
jgi:7,8-dihydroneopterin aldolase/epimerase/oxygenase